MNNQFKKVLNGPLLNHLNAGNRVCVAGVCKNTRNIVRAAPNANKSNQAFKNKVFLVRGVLRAFRNDEYWMNALSWKALNMFRQGRANGASNAWGSSLLGVNAAEVANYNQTGVRTMYELMKNKLKRVEDILTTMIKDLNINGQNLNGQQRVISNKFEVNSVDYNPKFFKPIATQFTMDPLFLLAVNDLSKNTVRKFVSKTTIHLNNV
tara:strand:+ start:354 stop:977 length:624 start_codon:yes stop_codon:yes gene_type:complete